MALTVVDLSDNQIPNKYELAGLTDDVVFRANPIRKYKVEGEVTSAGSAVAIASENTETPSDTDGFAANPDGATTATFQTVLEAGNEWAGMRIDSGTWTFRIREI